MNREKLQQHVSKIHGFSDLLQGPAANLLILTVILTLISQLVELNFINLEYLALVTGLICLIALKHEKTEQVIGSEKIKYVLALLIFIGLTLRLYDLGVPSMWFDETITANAAQSLLNNFTPGFPSGFEYGRALPHTILAATSTLLIGASDLAYRLPSVLIGILVIGLTYYLGKQLFDKQTGLIAATLITFMTWQIAWNRQNRMYPLLQLLYLTATILIYKITLQKQQKTLRNTLLFTITFVLAALTHPTAYILPFTLITYLTINHLLNGDKIKISKKHYKIGIPLTVLIGFLFANNYINRIQTILNTLTNNFPIYHNWITTQLPVTYILALIGITIPFRNGKTREGILLTLTVIPAAYIVIFHNDLVASRYLHYTVPFICIWAALTIKTTSKTLNQKTKLNRQKTTTILITLLVLVLGSYTLTPQTNYQLGINAPQPDFKNTHQHIQTKSSPNETLIAGWTAPALRYYKAPDYWLKFDHTGKQSYPTHNDTDLYTGAEIIHNTTQLNQTIQNKSGWIVLDDRAYNRQTPETQELIDNQTLAYSGKEIRVWKW